MKADPAHQVQLLEVQELDSRATQLRHQRAHLPELAEIAASYKRAAGFHPDVLNARASLTPESAS